MGGSNGNGTLGNLLNMVKCMKITEGTRLYNVCSFLCNIRYRSSSVGVR